MKHELLAYVGWVIQAARIRFAQAVGLIVLCAFTEGVGVALLLPILATAGLDAGEGPGAKHQADYVSRIIDAAGLEPKLPLLLAVFLLLSASRTILGRMQSFAIFEVEQELVLVFRQRLYSAIINAQWPSVCRIPSADLTHALTEQLGRIGTGSYVLLMLVGDVMVCSIYVMIAAPLSWVMTVFVVTCGLLLVFALRGTARRLHDSGETIAKAMNALYAGTIEHMQSLKTAKTYSAQQRNVQLFADFSGSIANAYLVGARRQASAGATFEIGSVLILCAALFGSIDLLKLPASQIMVLLLLFSRVMPRIMSAHQYFRNLATMLPAFAMVDTMIRQLEADAEPGGGIPRRLSLRRNLRLDAVSFNYQQGAAAGIHHLCMVIPAGKIVALVGPSGAGKSTVADVVMGLLCPDSGTLLLDGLPLRPADMAGWREQIGYVSQETVLFRMSLRQNLLWSCPGASESEIMVALRLAAADEFVRALPDGLETEIGERGFRLSQGERQRLALARALLRRPRLLVLDEATNSLDAENEARILGAICQLKDVAVLLISHRFTTVRWADLIYVIENGTVVEMGDWNSLMRRENGRFHALCTAQNEGASAVGVQATNKTRTKQAGPVGVE